MSIVLLIERCWACVVGIVLDEGLERMGEGGGRQRMGVRRPPPPKKSRHPVALFGRLAAWGEGRWNRGTPRARLWRGASWGAALLLSVFLLGEGVESILFKAGMAGVLVQGVLCAVLIAPAALDRCVALVEHALRAGDLVEARARASMLVGRETSRLDEAGTARAAIESLSENFSDATLAPLFWYMLLGVSGLFLYKAANTLDSQFGYRSARYRHFGRFSARFDDGINFFPARLSGGLIALSSGLVRGASVRGAFRGLWVSAPSFRAWARGGFGSSPNAPHPEAAIAGALRLKLGGPRRYLVAGEPIEVGEWVGEGRAQCTHEDIARARRVLQVSLIALLVLFALSGLVGVLWC